MSRWQLNHQVTLILWQCAKQQCRSWHHATDNAAQHSVGYVGHCGTDGHTLATPLMTRFRHRGAVGLAGVDFLPLMRISEGQLNAACGD